MRLSRPCYDKPWRCPGWAGGGMKWAKRDRCENGRMQGWHGRPGQQFTFHRCDRCNVVALPYAARWLSPWFVAGAVRTAWHLRGVP